jgi:hypothetical protein
VPPEYPEVALITPFTCWKTAWIPQKQPPATTAVSFPGVEALASSVAAAGTTPLPAWQASAPASNVNTIATIRTEILDINPPGFAIAIMDIRLTSWKEVSDVR